VQSVDKKQKTLVVIRVIRVIRGLAFVLNLFRISRVAISDFEFINGRAGGPVFSSSFIIHHSSFYFSFFSHLLTFLPSYLLTFFLSSASSNSFSPQSFLNMPRLFSAICASGDPSSVSIEKAIR